MGEFLYWSLLLVNCWLWDYPKTMWCGVCVAPECALGTLWQYLFRHFCEKNKLNRFILEIDMGVLWSTCFHLTFKGIAVGMKMEFCTICCGGCRFCCIPWDLCEKCCYFSLRFLELCGFYHFTKFKINRKFWARTFFSIRPGVKTLNYEFGLNLDLSLSFYLIWNFCPAFFRMTGGVSK
jgi:hypothetical protein